MTQLDRRAFLTLGLGSLALGMTACSTATGAPTLPAAKTFSEWAQSRQAPYYIAHRGAGTIIPEHSLPGYNKALEWGAEALELSVVMSSDGVLYCHHDLTLDRTTTLTGDTAHTPASRLDTGRILIPRLGPRWTGDGMPLIPRLDAVLDEVGRKILCIEAKDDAAYEPMMKVMEERKLLNQCMVKVGYTSRHIAEARAAGIPVFAYFGDPKTITTQALSELAAKLSAVDAIVLPARSTATELLSVELLDIAVATGIPVWVYPVHRRVEVDYFSAHGVQGIITPALGYVSGRLSAATRDSFSTRSLAPGVTTRDPYSDWDAVGWDTADAIELIGNGARSVLLGDLGPITAPEYRIDLEVAMMAGPMASSDAFVLGFGCPDDRYLAEGTAGYRLNLSNNGTLTLTVTDAAGVQREVGSPVPSSALAKDSWTTLSVAVAPQQITVSRDGADPLAFNDATLRGGYLHVGRSAGAARLAVRSVVVG